MLKVTKQQAIDKANKFVYDKYVYIYGYKESYNPVTKSKIDELAALYPQTFSQNYRDMAYALIGRRAIDCSGLVCQVLGMTDINSSSISQLHTTRPEDFEKVDITISAPGDILWKEGHVGVQISQNEVIEARSISKGVRIFMKNTQAWKYAIRPKYKQLFDYEKTGWYASSKGWWYAWGQTKGQYYKNQIVDIEGKMYMFDEEGYCLKTGFITTNELGVITNVFGERLSS